MVKNREGRRHNKNAVFRDQAELSKAKGSSRAASAGYESARKRRKAERKNSFSSKIRFQITVRKIRISPEKKRKTYIKRLERLIRILDRIIANPEGVEEIQLRAMEVLIKAVRLCYTIISDMEVEELEREVEDLKRREEKAGGKDRIEYVIK